MRLFLSSLAIVLIASFAIAQTSGTTSFDVDGETLAVARDADTLRSYNISSAKGKQLWKVEVRVNPDGEVEAIRMNHQQIPNKSWHIKDVSDHASWQDLIVMAKMARKIEAGELK